MSKRQYSDSNKANPRRQIAKYEALGIRSETARALNELPYTLEFQTIDGFIHTKVIPKPEFSESLTRLGSTT